ncbi:MAG: choice-of-anchor D domain-containing protein, partial [Candidatus Cloacimonetes bacterium]|nr:choice-of-anchor D domain-containing protein [Candidatus Cloacimonadota bacterium]
GRGDNHVVRITADSVTFSGFSVYGAEKPLDYKAGIYMNSADNCFIFDNRLGYLGHQNDYGILLENSHYNFISNNHCNYNNYTGLSQKNSTGNKLIGNESTNNVNYGIINMYCDSTELKYNVCNDNVIGIHFFDSHHSFIIGDTTNFNEYYGLNLRSSTYNQLFDNYARSNDDTGIRLSDNCNYNVMNQNRAELNLYGLKILSSSAFNTITGSDFINNSEHGMVLDNSDNNILTKNLSNDNTTFGLNIISSNNNNIYLNAFTNNSFAINSNSSINNWNSPTPLSYKYDEYSYHKQNMGNYYSNYSGSDLDEDGIGDTPYSLPGDEPQDNSPLALLPNNYFLHTWWLHNDSVMYQNLMTNPTHSVTIPSNVPYICNSNQQNTDEISFAASDYYNGQLFFDTALASGDDFIIEAGYSTDGDDFISSGQDTVITGDGSTRLFTFQTNDSRYTIPASCYFALRISNNNTGTNYDIITGGGASYLSAPRYNPQAGLTPPDSLNFGKVDTTDTADSTLTFLLKNSGNAVLIIDSISGLQQPFSVNFSPPETLQVNDSLFVSVTLEREYEVGTYIDTLHLYDNNDNSSLIITAQLTEPEISITPENIDFGSLAISDESDSLPFVINNLGTSDLIVNNVSGLSSPFTINYLTPDTIFPENDSTQVFITLDKSEPGIFNDTLLINNNDVDTSVVVTAELTEPTISINPTSLDFGTISTSDQIDSLSFFINNIGTGDLIVDGLTGLSSPYFVNYSLPETILPGDSSEIFVKLNLSTPGIYLDTLNISNNDTDTSLVVTAELTVPEIELSNNYIDFGTTSCAAAYDSLSFVIRNTGNEDLNIESTSGLSLPFEINY